MVNIRYRWAFTWSEAPPVDEDLRVAEQWEPEGSGWEPIGVSADGMHILWRRRAMSNVDDRFGYACNTCCDTKEIPTLEGKPGTLVPCPDCCKET